MRQTNRPTQSGSTNTLKKDLKDIHTYLSGGLKEIAPADDASDDAKNLFKLVTDLVNSLKR